MGRKRKNTTGIPDYEIDSLARALLPAIQKLFETEEGKRDFEAWQAERREKQLNNKKSKNISHWNNIGIRREYGGKGYRL